VGDLVFGGGAWLTFEFCLASNLVATEVKGPCSFADATDRVHSGCIWCITKESGTVAQHEEACGDGHLSRCVLCLVM
jgi:hypothetical protein